MNNLSASANSRVFFKFIIFCLILVLYLIYLWPSHHIDVNPSVRMLMNKKFSGNATVRQKYFMKTSKCVIPYIEPYNEEVMKIYSPREFIPCSNESELVSPFYDESRKRYVLHINENVAQELLSTIKPEFNCFYREIVHGLETESYDKIKPNIYFSQNYVVPQQVDGLLLECQTTGENPVTLQKDAFMFIQYRESNVTKSKQTIRKPSVIMYGIDTLSRINLRRTMPLVFEYLTGPGWYEMQGYNKVGDNSFPNIFAILSGHTPESAKEHVCNTDDKGCLDEIPMLWHYFKNASYLTAYAEDESSSNTFSYLKPGFTKTPTDYYFRPFLRALETETENYHCPGCRMVYCLGRRLANSYVYDYCKQFIQRYVEERPIWGMFWSNHFSHDDPFMPSAMQHKVLNDLLSYEHDGAFKHAIMIFFADHGVRFGDILSLSEGFLEERLPMMFIYLPPWFREKYPQFAEALAANQQRLSSNFDLHNTLKHIIELGGTPDGPALPRSYACPTCQSLFYPIAENRTCAQAGIAEHWCTCEPFRKLTNSHWSDRIALRIIERMNDYFVVKNISHLCSNLSLSYIHSTEIKTRSDDDGAATLPTIETAVYRTKFKVKQNSADFQATVDFNNATEEIQVNVEGISRTNSYKEDSTCINDKIAKLYCICFSDLKP